MISPLTALGAVAHPFLRVVCSAGLTALLAACSQATLQQASFVPPLQPQYAALSDRGVRIPSIEAETIDPKYLKQRVRYATSHPPGTVVVDPYAKFLYLIQEDGFAMRYGVGVGRDGFGWSGAADISRKAQWPTWTPPSAMVARQPELKPYRRGMPGGIENPLGARALYLFQKGKDTLYRIHGTNEPESIGKNVSSGWHPAYEPGRDRPVQSRTCWLQGCSFIRAGSPCGSSDRAECAAQSRGAAMRHPVLCAIAALALICMAPTARGQSLSDSSQKPDIKADLLAGHSEAGEAWIGVRIDLGPGWKTYWKSPGDAGLPPEFDWSGSSNLDHAEVEWPAPSRLSIQGIDTVGYTREVLFPIRIRVRDPAVETKVELKLAIYACSTICVREDLVLSGTIQPDVDGPDQATIDSWRSRVPQVTSDVLSVLEVERSTTGNASLRLSIASSKPLPDADAFVDSDPPLNGEKPVVTFGLDNRATLTVNLPGVTAESIRARPITATIVSGRDAVLATSPAPQASGADNPTGSSEGPRAAIGPHSGILALIGIALAGGFILNLMPCVFPVLSLKLLSFVHGSTANRSQIRRGFAASAAGILVSFLLLAGILAGIKAAGGTVGWGIQFQQPLFLAGMAIVLTLFAANQFDLIHLPVSSGFLTRVSGIAGGTSATAHFLSGFVATLLATPCSAPLVGTAVGFALSQGTAEIVAIFAALGVGMASPYLLVAAFPAVANIVPRPGPWLMQVKRLFGLALLASAGWLLLVLAEVTDRSVAIALGGSMIAFLAVWKRANLKNVTVAVTVIVATGAVFLATLQPRTGAQNEIPWRTFSNRDLKELVGAGHTVFVDVTADWCITCKINKAFVINKPEVAERFSSGIVPMRADWTKPDPEIAQFLRQHGRFGIPFNIVFGPAAPAGIALSEILSTSSVSAALNDAAETSNRSQPK